MRYPIVPYTGNILAKRYEEWLFKRISKAYARYLPFGDIKIILYNTEIPNMREMLGWDMNQGIDMPEKKLPYKAKLILLDEDDNVIDETTIYNFKISYDTHVVSSSGEHLRVVNLYGEELWKRYA